MTIVRAGEACIVVELESLTTNGKVKQVASDQVYIKAEVAQTYHGSSGFKDLELQRLATTQGASSAGVAFERQQEKINRGGAKTSVHVYASARYVPDK